MGGKVNVPISEETHDILFNDNFAACLNSSHEVITLYQMNGEREWKRLNSKETVQTLSEVDIEVSQEGKAYLAQFALKGFNKAEVTYFAKRYSGSAYFILALTMTGRKIDKAIGIADSMGNKVANAIVGTVVTAVGGLGGAAAGAWYGTTIVPGWGTAIGAVAGAVAAGYASGKIVEHVFIEKI